MQRCLKGSKNEKFGGIEISFLFLLTLNSIVVILWSSLAFIEDFHLVSKGNSRKSLV